MSQPEKPQVTTYSDETSMGSGNGGNGTNGGVASGRARFGLLARARSSVHVAAAGPVVRSGSVS